LKKMMKKSYSLTILIVLAILLTQLSTAHCEKAAIQSEALTYIENVLPINTEQYEITATNYFAYPSVNRYGAITTEEDVTYLLTSEETTLKVQCKFINSTFWRCRLTIQNGSVIYDQKNSKIVDITKRILEQHQLYSEKESTALIKTLNMVDATKNVTVISDNIKLTVENLIISEEANATSFLWAEHFEGADYTSIYISFENGVLHTIRDDRSLYNIGNTSILVSKDEALAIAMKYIENYSYTMIAGTEDNQTRYEVTGFNVTKENAITELYTSTARDSSTLYPYWSVTLKLNQTYPGSVYALLVGVWADSGEVFFCDNLGAGGSQVVENSTADPEQTDDLTYSTTHTIVAIVVILVIIMGLAIVLKKHR
jgi:hypothetical protein